MRSLRFDSGAGLSGVSSVGSRYGTMQLLVTMKHAYNEDFRAVVDSALQERG
jgi:hypothetical protein